MGKNSYPGCSASVPAPPLAHLGEQQTTAHVPASCSHVLPPPPFSLSLSLSDKSFFKKRGVRGTNIQPWTNTGDGVIFICWGIGCLLSPPRSLLTSQGVFTPTVHLAAAAMTPSSWPLLTWEKLRGVLHPHLRGRSSP